jgi:serine O-acetyltransferase
MARKKKLTETLDNTVRRIIQSYNRYGGINHIKGPTLPAQGEIIDTLQKLISIIFPGFFDRSDINTTNIKYHVGTEAAFRLAG